MSKQTPCYGVYRKLANGKLCYVSQSATQNKKLAEEIAQGLSDGEITLPTGAIQRITPHPHVVRQIGDADIEEASS